MKKWHNLPPIAIINLYSSCFTNCLCSSFAMALEVIKPEFKYRQIYKTKGNDTQQFSSSIVRCHMKISRFPLFNIFVELH